jgi:acetolactate synthase I/II/III large subunit
MNPNGAHILLRTLLQAGIDTCFTNPGTSEIEVVAALDSEPRMRAILTLFEGVATGAADGYARMADRPGATLLHLGPGLANGLANLHNARRGRVPIVNLVGDHATYHAAHDAPLQSDIETIARNVSAWVRTSTSTGQLARDAADAITAACGPPGQVATLIVPADVAWGTGDAPAAAPSPPPTPPAASDGEIEAIARVIRSGRRTGILLGGRALRERGLLAAARVAAGSGVRLLAEMFPARLERGAGLPAVERLLYWPELATAQLAGLEQLILVDTAPPVSFFAYPGQRSSLLPDGCEVHELASPSCDVVQSLEKLVDAIDAAGATPTVQAPSVPPPLDGPLTAATVCQVVATHLPEGAIVSDEAITSGAALPLSTAGAARHDWLTLTGGAIGQGLPVAVGAAVASPDRPVIALQADGSALYTMQSLWTMAREGLDVTIVLFNNGGYNILGTELVRAGVQQRGPRAAAQVDLGDPGLDFVALGSGLGVPSQRVDAAGPLGEAMARAIAEPGPHLIDVAVPAELPPAVVLRSRDGSPAQR